jgi:hypothetical protein
LERELNFCDNGRMDMPGMAFTTQHQRSHRAASFRQ